MPPVRLSPSDSSGRTSPQSTAEAQEKPNQAGHTTARAKSLTSRPHGSYRSVSTRPPAHAIKPQKPTQVAKSYASGSPSARVPELVSDSESSDGWPSRWDNVPHSQQKDVKPADLGRQRSDLQKVQQYLSEINAFFAVGKRANAEDKRHPETARKALRDASISRRQNVGGFAHKGERNNPSTAVKPRSVVSLMGGLRQTHSKSKARETPSHFYPQSSLEQEGQPCLTLQTRLHADTLLKNMLRIDWQTDISQEACDTIINYFSEMRQTSPRLGRFQTKEQLLGAITRGIRNKINKPVGLPGKIVLLFANDGFVDEGPSEGTTSSPLPLLMQLDAGQLPNSIEIIDMLCCDPDNYKQMWLRNQDYPLPWWMQTLSFAPGVAEYFLQDMQKKVGRFGNRTRPSVKILEVAVQRAFSRRDDDYRPVCLQPKLWRLVVSIYEQDIPVLVSLHRGKKMHRIWIDDANENRSGAIHECVLLNKRRKHILNRIWTHDLSTKQSFLRLAHHLESTSEGYRFSPEDVVSYLENHPDWVETSDERFMPLQRLSIEILEGETLSWVALFEENELIELCHEDDDAASDKINETRTELVAFKLSDTLYKSFCAIRRLYLDPTIRPTPEHLENELPDLVEALATHEKESGLQSSMRELVADVIRRGAGRLIDPDYPELRVYTGTLHDSEGVLKHQSFLARITNGIRIEELYFDNPANRKNLLAYHLHTADLKRIMAQDTQSLVPGTGHGFITHLAIIDHLTHNCKMADLDGAPEDLDAEPAEVDLEKVGSASFGPFLKKVVSQNEGDLIDEDNRQIYKFNTGLRDTEDLPIYLLARVHASSILDVRLCDQRNWLKILSYKKDPETYVSDIQHQMGYNFSAGNILGIVNPNYRTRPFDGAANPAWHIYKDNPFVKEGTEIIAQVQDNVISQIAIATRANWVKLTSYKVSVEQSESVFFDEASRSFMSAHKENHESVWQYLLTQVRQGRGMQVPNWSQLEKFTASSSSRSHLSRTVTILAHVENGDIQSARADSSLELKRLQKKIGHDIARHGWRISQSELRHRHSEIVHHVVSVLLKQQNDFDSINMQTILGQRDEALTDTEIDLQKQVTQTAKQKLYSAFSASGTRNFAALDEDIFELIDYMLKSERYETVLEHPDIRRYIISNRHNTQISVVLYAHFDGNFLIDASIGEKGIERLVQSRLDMFDALSDIHTAKHFAKDIVNIYIRDRFLRGSSLVDIFEKDINKFAFFLEQNIVFTKGAVVEPSNGIVSKLFRRYTLTNWVEGGGIELYAVFDWDTPLSERNPKTRLRDVCKVPAPTEETYKLSPFLLTQIKFLENNRAYIVMPQLTAQTQQGPEQTSRHFALRNYERTRRWLEATPNPSEHQALDSQIRGPADGSDEPVLIDFGGFDIVRDNRGTVGGVGFQLGNWAAPIDTRGDNFSGMRSPPEGGHATDDLMVPPRLLEQGFTAEGVRIEANMVGAAGGYSMSLPFTTEATSNTGNALGQDYRFAPWSPSNDLPSTAAFTGVHGLTIPGAGTNNNPLNMLNDVSPHADAPWRYFPVAGHSVPTAVGTNTNVVSNFPQNVRVAGTSETSGSSHSYDGLNRGESDSNIPSDGSDFEAYFDRQRTSRRTGLGIGQSGAAVDITDIYRIEHNEDDADRFITDARFYSTPSTFEYFCKNLLPSDNATLAAQAILDWWQSVAQPRYESPLNELYPDLKIFKSSFFDDKGEPFYILGKVEDGRVSNIFFRDQDGNNEKKLLGARKAKPTRARARTEMTQTKLSSADAQRKVEEIKIPTALLNKLFSAILMNNNGIHLLRNIFGSGETAPCLTPEHVQLKTFIMHGIHKALQREHDNAQYLTLRTGVIDTQICSPVNIAITLIDDAVTSAWVVNDVASSCDLDALEEGFRPEEAKSQSVVRSGKRALTPDTQTPIRVKRTAKQSPKGQPLQPHGSSKSSPGGVAPRRLDGAGLFTSTDDTDTTSSDEQW